LYCINGGKLLIIVIGFSKKYNEKTANFDEKSK
jgi:hypothetical protein